MFNSLYFPCFCLKIFAGSCTPRLLAVFLEKKKKKILIYAKYLKRFIFFNPGMTSPLILWYKKANHNNIEINTHIFQCFINASLNVVSWEAWIPHIKWILKVSHFVDVYENWETARHSLKLWAAQPHRGFLHLCENDLMTRTIVTICIIIM